MTITLSAEKEAKLRKRAAREGQEPDAVAEELLASALDAPPPSDDMALRPFGLCAGEFVVPDDFNAPLDDDMLEEFERA